MSKQTDTIEKKGRKAFCDGEPRKAPYADVMCGRHNHIVTGARAAINAWLRGYDDESGTIREAIDARDGT